MLLLAGTTASAAIQMNITEVGSDVQLEASGTVNLTLLNFDTPATAAIAGVFPGGTSGGYATTQAGFTSNGVDAYTGISGPTSIGPSVLFTQPDSGSGDFLFVQGITNTLGVPAGYVSFDSISGTSTYNNTTIADLGLTPGTYQWTWGSGPNADSFTLNIIPEPASLALLGIGLLALTPSRRHRQA